MVPSIARQSVILKCNMQKSVMLGNYEFFYAAGLMRKLYNIEIRTDMEPVQTGKQPKAPLPTAVFTAVKITMPRKNRPDGCNPVSTTVPGTKPSTQAGKPGSSPNAPHR